MSVDTPTPLDLSLTEVGKQRTIKRPWMLGLKATRNGVETIKKIREHELHGRLEAMVWVPFTLGPRTTSTSKPFDLPLLFERLG